MGASGTDRTGGHKGSGVTGQRCLMSLRVWLNPWWQASFKKCHYWSTWDLMESGTNARLGYLNLVVGGGKQLLQLLEG